MDKPSLLPSTPTQTVRERWLEVLNWSYGSRRVTWLQLEPGVNAIIVPMPCYKEMDKDLLDAEVRMAFGHLPSMARGLRVDVGSLREFALSEAREYQGWLGEWGKDISTGETQVTVLIDLAYLEAALLARLWEHEVIIEFGSPLAFFRRGALSDYVDVHEAVSSMVAEGASLSDTAESLATRILGRLQMYAEAYLQLSTLYTQGVWHIHRDNFIIKDPDSARSLTLQYWQLRIDSRPTGAILSEWRQQIEDFLDTAALCFDPALPKSFAA